MSSAVLIRDVLATGDKVHQIWNYFVDAPPEYGELTRELNAFYLTFSDLVAQTARIKILLEREDETRGKQLKGICDSAAPLLEDFVKFVKKNKPADDEAEIAEQLRNGPKPAGTKRTWRRYDGAENVYDLPRLKQIMILNHAAILDFRSVLAASAQGRLGPAIERQDYLAMAIFELIASAVPVDEHREGAKNSSQTPTPVDRDKVAHIWKEYGISPELTRRHQAEVDAYLDDLSGNKLSRTKTSSASVSQLSLAKYSKEKTPLIEPPQPSQQSKRPFTILLDDRTQSHVGPLFAHHLRSSIANSTPSNEPYITTILNLELCTQSPTQNYTPTTDAKLSTTFLRFSPLVPCRHSLYRPRRPTDPWTFDLILCAGYGGIPPQYTQTFYEQNPGAVPRSHDGQRMSAEIYALESLAHLSKGKKFTSPLSRSLMTMSAKGAWERSEKEVLKALNEFANQRLKVGPRGGPGMRAQLPQE